MLHLIIHQLLIYLLKPSKTPWTSSVSTLDGHFNHHWNTTHYVKINVIMSFLWGIINRFKMTEWIWPKNLNMTEIFTLTNLNIGTWPKMYDNDKHQWMKYLLMITVHLFHLTFFKYCIIHLQKYSYLRILNKMHTYIHYMVMNC